MKRTDLRNVAIIAHVDHGKTTLVDAMLKQSVQDIFIYEQNGCDENGKVIGRFKPTGIRPKFLEKLSATGINIPNEVFWPK